MDIAFRRHISYFSIGAVTFKFPNHDAIFAALNQIEINLLGMEKACPSDAFECNLVAAAGAAPFLIIQRPLDRDFLFAIGTIAGFGASLRFFNYFSERTCCGYFIVAAGTPFYYIRAP